MPVDLDRSRVLIALLESATSLSVVSQFLKSRSLHHSAGSWQAMRDVRLLPALSDEKISNKDLEDLLCDAEEFGRQHVFLYECDPSQAIALIDRNRVRPALAALELEHLLDGSTIVENPTGPQIVDVRWDTADVDYRLTIKEIELRTYEKLIGTEDHGNRFHKVYERVSERAVNIARLHRNGSLEIRIAARRNSTKYEADIYNFFRRIGSIIPSEPFKEYSITTAKGALWRRRTELTKVLRFTDSTVRNSAGNALRAATGRMEQDLSSDAAVAGSIDGLLGMDQNAYCDSANVWFKKSDALSQETHVMLSGENNEFALPANCIKGDYEYVLGQIQLFNL